MFRSHFFLIPLYIKVREIVVRNYADKKKETKINCFIISFWSRSRFHQNQGDITQQDH